MLPYILVLVAGQAFGIYFAWQSLQGLRRWREAVDRRESLTCELQQTVWVSSVLGAVFALASIAAFFGCLMHIPALAAQSCYAYVCFIPARWLDHLGNRDRIELPKMLRIVNNLAIRYVATAVLLNSLFLVAGTVGVIPIWMQLLFVAYCAFFIVGGIGMFRERTVSLDAFWGNAAEKRKDELQRATIMYALLFCVLVGSFGIISTVRVPGILPMKPSRLWLIDCFFWFALDTFDFLWAALPGIVQRGLERWRDHWAR